jgi:two-component system sensor histidine kinase DctS
MVRTRREDADGGQIGGRHGTLERPPRCGTEAKMTESGAPAGIGDDGLTVRAADRDLKLDDLAFLNRMTTVGQVLPNVAHELNNALQIIGGMVEMLAAREGLPADVTDKIGRIGAQAGRATELLRELVTFARRDNAGTALVDVSKVVERALGFRRYHLGRARITAVVEAPPPGEAMARLDGAFLQQIVLNLLINAEHSLAGRTDGRIQIGIAPRAGEVEVTVQDNGQGLPDHLATRGPEPFFTTRLPAAGLGLTVASGLARGLGGRLTLRPNPEGGTVASLTLPTAAERRSGP